MQKVKILIIDDEPEICKWFKAQLEITNEYTVSTTLSGEEGLQKLQKEVFGLVFLDIIMPTKDGLEVLQEISQNPKKFNNPKIIVLTNLDNPEIKNQCLKLGAIDFLVKAETDIVETTRHYIMKLYNNNQDQNQTK